MYEDVSSDGKDHASKCYLFTRFPTSTGPILHTHLILCLLPCVDLDIFTPQKSTRSWQSNHSILEEVDHKLTTHWRKTADDILSSTNMRRPLVLCCTPSNVDRSDGLTTGAIARQILCGAAIGKLSSSRP